MTGGEGATTQVLQNLLTAWEPYKAVTGLPEHAVRLWGEGGYGVWLADTLGPPVPYPPVDRDDGHKNHGYRRVKEDAIAIAQIPELEGWPEFRKFLEAINAAESPIESVGCEKGFFSTEDKILPPVRLGSFVDVIFTDLALNANPLNFLHLTATLIPKIRDCEKWWADISFALQRLKFLPGVEAPWGLMFQIKNYGRTQAEARQFWGESLRRLAQGISDLPVDFGNLG